MAKSISSMYVTLGGDVTGFARAFESAKASVAGLQSGLSSASSFIARMAGPLTAVVAPTVALGAAASEIKQAFDDLDRVAKLSDRLGASTESIAALEHAADLAGVSNEQLAGGMEKMLRTLGEAASGSKTASAAFRRLGLDADSLAKADSSAALAQIADGLKGISNPAARASAAVAVFGKSGQQLLPLLLSGSEGLRQAAEEAERLNLTFSRADAAAVEEVNDAMSRLNASVTGLGRVAAVEVSPFFQSIIDGARDAVAALGELGKDLGRLDFDRVLKDAEAAVSSPLTGDLAAQIEQVEKNMKKLRDAKGAGDVRNVAHVSPTIASLGASMLPRELEAVSTAASVASAMLSQLAPSTGVSVEAFKKLNAQTAEQVRILGILKELKADVDRHAAAAAAAEQQHLAAEAAAAEVQVKNAKNVISSLDKLKAAHDVAGLSAEQRSIMELKSQGANASQLKQAESYLYWTKVRTDELARQKKEAEDLARTEERTRDEARQLYEATRTDAEKYAAELERINAIQSQGFIDAETASRAAQQAREKMNAAEPKLAPIVRVGSAEAFALRHQPSTPRGASDVVGIAKRQLDETVKLATAVIALPSRIGSAVAQNFGTFEF